MTAATAEVVSPSQRRASLQSIMNTFHSTTASAPHSLFSRSEYLNRMQLHSTLTETFWRFWRRGTLDLQEWLSHGRTPV